MNQPQRKRANPREEAALFQISDTHSLNAEGTNRNSLLGVVACHWNAAGIERRLMYLGALQAGKAVEHAVIDCAFADFDHTSQVALLGAIVLRCPEMFRHFVAEGFL